MASSKQDEEAAAAEQLGSISLGKSEERKDENTEDAEENNEAPTKLCSACDKESDALMKCRACKCVWYCDKKCQNKHWKEHKKECKSIKIILDQRGGKLDLGTEEDIGPLGKLPPREECPICMQVLPIHEPLQGYSACCGKTICCGCNLQHRKQNKERRQCAFCREPIPQSDQEYLARLRKRIERKDPQALHNMAMHYGAGRLGMPAEQGKCIELLREAAGLGYPPAQFTLGNFHDDGEMGLEENKEEALKYFKEAAEGGHIRAQNNLACTEAASGDLAAAMHHWRLSASGGFRPSMEGLIQAFFGGGVLHHGDLAETLQSFYHSRAEMKSEDRDRYIEHLKETGEYVAENHDF